MITLLNKFYGIWKYKTNLFLLSYFICNQQFLPLRMMRQENENISRDSIRTNRNIPNRGSISTNRNAPFHVSIDDNSYPVNIESAERGRYLYFKLYQKNYVDVSGFRSAL